MLSTEAPLARPISLSQLRLTAPQLAALKTSVAIDRGSTFTKIMYLPQTTREPAQELHRVLFDSAQFDAAIQWTRSHAQLSSSDGQVRVTGVACESYKQLIQEQLGLTPVFVAEQQSHHVGLHFLVTNFPEEDFCYPPEEIEVIKDKDDNDGKSESSITDHTKKAPEVDSENPSKFPVLFSVCGSENSFISKVAEDGKAELLGKPAFSGKVFMGLNRLLLNTESFDEMEALAKRGDRRKVDDEAKDMVQKGGAYSFYPPDEPMYSFGKVTEQNRDLKSFQREDLAHAIIGHTTDTFLNTILVMSGIQTKCGYFGGSLVHNSPLRKEITRVRNFYNSMGFPIKPIKFLNFTHTAAIGAMVADLPE